MVRGNFDLTDKELGNYKVVRKLGKGGMASVYKAHELSLNRMVALKVLEPHLSEDPAFIKRFEREAQAAAQLNHPNIVQIYAIGEADGFHYIAMEYVKGEPLSDLIRREGLVDPRKAVRIIRQAAESLREAHAAGLVHRDVKPHNILIDSTGRVKVTDFGIAFIPQADTRLTQAGAVIGTPEYISPEQCQSKPVDARSDLYSLGVTFYEMLTGKTPYQADTPVSMLMKIVEGKFLPLAEANPDVPGPLRMIVERMMNPDAAARYQSADELIVALDAWAAGAAVPEPPPLPRESVPGPMPSAGGDNAKNALILAGVVLLLAGLAFGGWKLAAMSRGDGEGVAPRGEHSRKIDVPRAVSEEENVRHDTALPVETAVTTGPAVQEREEARNAGIETPGVESLSPAAPEHEKESVPLEREQPERRSARLTTGGDATEGVLPKGAAPTPVRPAPPWNSILITVEGNDYEASMVDALVAARFREARYLVVDEGQGGGDLTDRARFHGVVSLRQLGSQMLNYYGRESELYSLALNMKIVRTDDGRIVAGPQSRTVKYTALTAEEKLGGAVAELSYALQEELSRLGAR